MSQNYEEAKKNVIRGLIILAIVTLVEVFISLLGKGHIIGGIEKYKTVLYIAGIVIAALSLYKAYFITYEFMHMSHEVKDLARTVIMPTLLLTWMVIAFLWDGTMWENNRENENHSNTELVEESIHREYQEGHHEGEGLPSAEEEGHGNAH